MSTQHLLTDTDNCHSLAQSLNKSRATCNLPASLTLSIHVVCKQFNGDTVIFQQLGKIIDEYNEHNRTNPATLDYTTGQICDLGLCQANFGLVRTI